MVEVPMRRNGKINLVAPKIANGFDNFGNHALKLVVDNKRSVSSDACNNIATNPEQRE